MTEINRRNFVKGAAAAAGSLFAIGTASRPVLGANDTLQAAVSGINGRGKDHISELLGIDKVQIVALIDPDSRLFEPRGKLIEDKTGKKPMVFQDIRKALEIKEIDVLTIATTNHWHALSAIWACQAGKDVYVEKPCCHNVFEGRVLVEAAKKYNRIVQHGTQGRSEDNWWKLAEIVKKGAYGKLLISRGVVYKRRDTIGFKANEAPPKELDYELWLGPAPEQFYNPNLVHYNWHWFWDFGNGDIGNQGVHQMDIARWMIPGATLPKKVLTAGGRFGYVDQGQTPNTMISVMDFGETQLIFEVRGLPSEKYFDTGTGNVLHFEAGVVANDKFYPKGDMTKAESLPAIDVKMGPGKTHFNNFIESVRSRKTSDLNAPIMEGFYSSALCHLANISYRVGRPVPFVPRRKVFGENAAAYETLDRMEKHLVNNKVSLDESAYFVGRELKIDAVSEQIIDDVQANDLLTRYYRKPFVVPGKSDV